MNRRRNQLVNGSAVPSPQDLALARAMLDRLKAGKDLRVSKIRRLKTAIRSDEYENSLKVEVAAERVADEIK